MSLQVLQRGEESQHLYLFGDRFRTLQRKANPLKKTLFSLMVAQHQQIIKWLSSLPAVDNQRIGFYGLSYGGKSAMRIPALVDLLSSAALSQASFVILSGSSWSHPLLAKRPSYTAGEARKTSSIHEASGLV